MIISAELKKRLLWTIRILVSVGLLLYLIYLINWDQFITTITLANKTILIIVFFMTLCGFWFSAWRWSIILLGNQIRFSKWQAYLGYLKGLFYSVFLPGVLGGDAVRIAICKQQTHCAISTSTATVLLERAGGLISLFIILFGVSIVSPHTITTFLIGSDPKILMIMGGIGITIIGLVFATRSWWTKWTPDIGNRGIVSKALKFLHSFIQTFSTLKTSTLLLVLLLSILFQVSDIIVTYLISIAIGLNIPLEAFFVVIPITYLVLVIPFSLGGLGIREGTMVFLLAKYGASASTAVLFSFLIYINRMAVGLIGGAVQFFEILSGARKDLGSEYPQPGPKDH